jgi:hypothetical protein
MHNQTKLNQLPLILVLILTGSCTSSNNSSQPAGTLTLPPVAIATTQPSTTQPATPTSTPESSPTVAPINLTEGLDGLDIDAFFDESF